MIIYFTFAFIFMAMDAMACVILKRKYSLIGSLAMATFFPLSGSLVIWFAVKKTKNFPSMDDYIKDLEHR